jgi:hypothetical protein
VQLNATETPRQDADPDSYLRGVLMETPVWARQSCSDEPWITATHCSLASFSIGQTWRSLVNSSLVVLTLSLVHHTSWGPGKLTDCMAARPWQGGGCGRGVCPQPRYHIKHHTVVGTPSYITNIFGGGGGGGEVELFWGKLPLHSPP